MICRCYELFKVMKTKKKMVLRLRKIIHLECREKGSCVVTFSLNLGKISED